MNRPALERQIHSLNSFEVAASSSLLVPIEGRRRSQVGMLIGCSDVSNTDSEPGAIAKATIQQRGITIEFVTDGSFQRCGKAVCMMDFW